MMQEQIKGSFLLIGDGIEGITQIQTLLLKEIIIILHWKMWTQKTNQNLLVFIILKLMK